MGRRQHDHQGAEHARRLFCVPMRHEEAALVINQQLVKLGCNRSLSATQPLGHAPENSLEIFLPGLAAYADFLRRHLPHLAHGYVEDSFLAASVSSADRLLT